MGHTIATHREPGLRLVRENQHLRESVLNKTADQTEDSGRMDEVGSTLFEQA